jgi:hypothetical protein
MLQGSDPGRSNNRAKRRVQADRVIGSTSRIALWRVDFVGLLEGLR